MLSVPLRLSILGSTGSVGTQTLDVVRRHPDRLRVEALVAGRNIELLLEQVQEFRPRFVGVAEEESAAVLRPLLPPDVTVEAGDRALEIAAALQTVDTVVVAIVGFKGLIPVLAALRADKDVALANKESLVSAGPLVRAERARSRGVIFPVDSEHSSIFQCLCRRGLEERPRRIVLTASGGPFRDRSHDELRSVTPADAVKHPRWNMGAKISVDSATLMNKGLEVIEAAMLFDFAGEQIEVLVHPESVVHGMVEYSDGAVIGAMFSADMRVPIAYALHQSAVRQQGTGKGSIAIDGFESGAPPLDLAKWRSLTFERPDTNRFPLLALAYRALEQGGAVPAVLNGANEVAVQRFLAGEIGFLEISDIVHRVVERAGAELAGVMTDEKFNRIEGFVEADAWGRSAAS